MNLQHSEIARYGRAADVIGLPDRAVTITNSERSDLACSRAWWFGYGLGMRPRSVAEPLRFGDLEHQVLEHVYGFWRDRPGEEYQPAHLDWCPYCLGDEAKQPCAPCGSTGEGPWAAIAKRSMLASVEAGEEYEDAAALVENLRRVSDGYLHVYNRAPPKGLRILAVEIALAAPVISDRGGGEYRPAVNLSRQPGGWWRFARSGDVDQSEVRWPWYFVGRLDALAEDEKTGVLWVIEHKTSKDPKGYCKGLEVDPQTAGYVRLVRHAVDAGLLRSLGIEPGRKVGGYLYDVLSSTRHRDPEVLVKGGLSKAKNRNTPSWRYEQAVADAGLAVADYAEHIGYLREAVDPKLYLREWAPVGPDRLAEHAEETLATAKRIADLRRAVAAGERPGIAFPRTPVCRRAGSGCRFAGPCACSPAPTTISDGFEVSDGQRWKEGQHSEPLPFARGGVEESDPRSSPARGVDW